MAEDEGVPVVEEFDPSLIITVGVVGAICVVLWFSIIKVKEKQMIVLQRCGRFHRVLDANLHFTIPFVDRPRRFSWRYYSTSSRGGVNLVVKNNEYIVSTKTEVMDFPKQDVISRDNARVTLDAILNYRITKPKLMLYNTQNLPYMLSKLLQAQIRNTAGTLDVDKIVDDVATLASIKGTLNEITRAWGVEVEKVGVQQVQTHELKAALAKRKEAELNNKKIVIEAKTTKQTLIVGAEGRRDQLIKLAEGTKQQTVSRARGEAKAIRMRAEADARSVREIARAVSGTNENPLEYLLAVKYIDMLQAVMMLPNTHVDFLPKKTAFLLAAKDLGINTILPSSR